MADQKENKIDDLLDSALQDFDKPSATTTPATTAGSTTNDDGTNGAMGLQAAMEALTMGDGSFSGTPEERAKLFSMHLNSMCGFGAEETPEEEFSPKEMIKSAFTKMSEMMEGTGDGDWLQEAMKKINVASDDLTSAAAADPATFLPGGDMESALGNLDMFLPVMEDLMQNILSADILLPMMNDLNKQYPKYLEENADKLSPEDRQRYEKQMELYASIKEILESENASDSAAVRREKYQAVLEQMRKMKDYGLPPPEFGDDLIPATMLPTDSPQCAPM